MCQKKMKTYNWAPNTEPQLQEAASPQTLWSGWLQRYVEKEFEL
jgi:hypothetical protein